MSESSKSEGSAYHERATFHHPNFTGNKPNLSVNLKNYLVLKHDMILGKRGQGDFCLTKAVGGRGSVILLSYLFRNHTLGLVCYNFAKRC